VGEAVLVAETVAGRPPGTHVRVLRLGDQYPPEALLLDRLRAVEELQQVVLFEVEGERAVGAVDLDPQHILAAESEPGGLQHPRGTAGEPGREQRGVVHSEPMKGIPHHADSQDIAHLSSPFSSLAATAGLALPITSCTDGQDASAAASSGLCSAASAWR
jgi:hypothetical protein